MDGFLIYELYCYVSFVFEELLKLIIFFITYGFAPLV